MYKQTADHPPYHTMIMNIYKNNGNIPLTKKAIKDYLFTNYKLGTDYEIYIDQTLRRMIDRDEIKQIPGTYKYIYNF